MHFPISSTHFLSFFFPCLKILGPHLGSYAFVPSVIQQFCLLSFVEHPGAGAKGAKVGRSCFGRAMVWWELWARKCMSTMAR